LEIPGPYELAESKHVNYGDATVADLRGLAIMRHMRPSFLMRMRGRPGQRTAVPGLPNSPWKNGLKGPSGLR